LEKTHGDGCKGHIITGGDDSFIYFADSFSVCPYLYQLHSANFADLQLEKRSTTLPIGAKRWTRKVILEEIMTQLQCLTSIAVIQGNKSL
jgi:hypothetical protein